MNSGVKLIISVCIIAAVGLSSYYGSNWSFKDSLSTLTLSNSSNSQSQAESLRIGYFPNVNHAQGVIGLNLGEIESAIKKNKNLENISIEKFVFTAGPSAIEALYAGQIDVAYVGPTPAISGYVSSGGEGLRIISGSSSGGVVFVVRNDSGINSINDLGGKKFATPQLGNTQDVSLRTFLMNNGYNTIDQGGNVTIVNTKPPDTLTLFLKKEIDGAWVPEPLGAKLLEETDSKILIDERDLWPPQNKFATTNIIAQTDYLKNNPEIIKEFLDAHVNMTLMLKEQLSSNNTQDRMKIVSDFNEGLKQITDTTIPENEVMDSLSRVDYTIDPLSQSLIKMAEDTQKLGFISQDRFEAVNISKIYDLELLNQVLRERGMTEVR